MKEICGCCEGIETVTPISNVNRPGLNALAYRAGTHATFLETMLARLSFHHLESHGDDEGEADATSRHEHPTPHTHPLHSLTTRAPHDASIALLDAWATVADVLTFYQERIANEGYLRTATERRSVLELARLLGYRPRPGVSASVHLAYTLEDDKEALIPAGTRAQSVPARPGELPQSFETAEDMRARADWNTLQPRLTWPQSLRPAEFNKERPIYLKGTATNLKANDPVLIDFGKAKAELFRVVEVEPDQSADRTKVVLRKWLETFTPETQVIQPTVGMSPEPFAGQQSALVRQIIERYRRAEEFGVNSATQTAQQVLALLEDLNRNLPSGLMWAELRDQLLARLAPLREKHRQAREGNFTKLEPWIGGIVSGLEEVLDTVAGEIAKAAATANTTTGGKTATNATSQESTQSALALLAPLLESLEKPASLQPASKQQLEKALTDALSPASDALPQLLTALRPALRPLLYKAWRHVSNADKATTPARVYALRTRAAVFGNNAPLKPIANKDTGRVERHVEWTLFADDGAPSTETFNIGISFSSTSGEFPQPLINTTVGITGATTPAQGNSSNVVSNQAFDIALTAANNESVRVTFSQVDPSFPARLRVSFKFQVRGISVIADRSSQSEWSIRSEGAKPDAVTFTHVVTTVDGQGVSLRIQGEFASAAGQKPTEKPNRVSLDASHNQILPGSWTVLERPSPLGTAPTPLVITRATRVYEGSRADYGMTVKGTQIELGDDWIAPRIGGDDFGVIRGTTVFTQSELLELAEEPIDPLKRPLCGNRIELAALVSGLEPGRWLIVTGERTDVQPKAPAVAASGQFARDSAALITTAGEATGVAATTSAGGAGTTTGGAGTTTGGTGTTTGGAGAAGDDDSAKKIVGGLRTAELVMLSGIEQGFDGDVSGDTTHTTLLLAEKLAYCYKLDTVRIYGNVVRATHGETRTEVLGSGDASKALQSFTLSQQPLTHVSAPTPDGIESTLQVRAGDILWHEVESLAGLGQKDRNYVTKTGDDGKTNIVFGNGREGARLPTGAENVRAKYRVGIGRPGNVKAERISIAVTKPLGVKEVVNPLAATGGADRESRDEARRNAPLAVMSLDRLVSTRDYEDFACTFAGVGKASATRLSDGRRQVVHLTIAGADDIPISPTSDLIRNLGEALKKYGDPYQPVQIATRFLKALVISARVRIHADYLWEAVEPKVRAAVLEHFSFQRRALGQDVVLSEVIGAMQSVEGVVYVDVDALDAVEETISPAALLEVYAQLRLNQRIRAYLARVDKTALDSSLRMRPAQLALVTPLVPETLNLTELKG